MPLLDLLLQKNPIKLLLQKHGLLKTVFPVTKFGLDRSAERSHDMSIIKEKGLQALRNASESGYPSGHENTDLLSKFTQAQHDHPDFMTDDLVLTSCLSMIFAGSETTAITLSAIFYFLLKNKRVYEKLINEIDDAFENGTIKDEDGNGIPTYFESQNLPYLNAVIQESFRLHPAPGLLLERVVPACGVDILGHFIPGGTIVGCNAWVLHRRPEIFGEDVEVFRPERWIEATKEQLKDMKGTMFQFGAGARTCRGKNISLLEVFKVVPALLRGFDVSSFLLPYYAVGEFADFCGGRLSLNVQRWSGRLAMLGL
jgi:cytochrome P450